MKNSRRRSISEVIVMVLPDIFIRWGLGTGVSAIFSFIQIHNPEKQSNIPATKKIRKPPVRRTFVLVIVITVS